MTSPYRLSGVCIYPIKSAAGLRLGEGRLTARGLAFDRRWMLVDSRGAALTQRQHPRLRLVCPSLHEHHLTVRAPGMPPLALPLQPGGPVYRASMWGRDIHTRLVSPAADAWFSAFLGRSCALVYQPDESRRLRGEQPGGALLNLSDGNPLHLISEASVEALNTRLDKKVDVWRFRPNLIVAGGLPHDEDRWRRLRIGETECEVVEPCARCMIVNVDEQGGVMSPLLRTLAAYRRSGRSILFGQHLEHRQLGTLRVGDSLEVLQRGPPPELPG